MIGKIVEMIIVKTGARITLGTTMITTMVMVTKHSQGIGQSQSSSQNSQCVSGGSTSASCNNISVQNQQNSGNNALAQDGNGKGGNKASQGIGQSQSSSQNSQVVSGGNTVGSGNNFNFQNQVNTGNNALAQR